MLFALVPPSRSYEPDLRHSEHFPILSQVGKLWIMPRSYDIHPFSNRSVGNLHLATSSTQYCLLPWLRRRLLMQYLFH